MGKIYKNKDMDGAYELLELFEKYKLGESIVMGVFVGLGAMYYWFG